jgi:hypothetical protein
MNENGILVIFCVIFVNYPNRGGRSRRVVLSRHHYVDHNEAQSIVNEFYNSNKDNCDPMMRNVEYVWQAQPVYLAPKAAE